MTPIPYTLEHYPTLCTWWTAHGWTPPPLEHLPALGLIIPDKAAAFLYIDPTANLAGLEFLVTNPANSPMQSLRAIAAISNTAAEIAKSMGKTAIFTTCKQPSLARLLQGTGFIETDTNMIHLIRPLNSPSSTDH